jgi:signal transduction histidine kinase
VGDRRLQNTKNKIYFNFSYKALKLLGDGLYSNPWTAISELVANGIDAEATKIYIHINMINKSSSIIEIFDNGYGMDYDDLAEKYALIGKNKRFDADLDKVRKNIVMGRKGIGKLAALYLSSNYFLVSKTSDDTNCWSINMTNITEDDVPNMKRVNIIQIESEKQWDKCTTGTLIKLVNVDLRNIGEQTLDGLKARIADYYSFEKETVTISVSLRQKEKDNILFEKIDKQIAFKNFYAFYNNSKINFNDKLPKTVMLSTSIPTKIKGPKDGIFYKKCPIKIINKYFITQGENHFLQENGQESKDLFFYEMRGWIGIHSTIEKNEAKDNDNLFLRNRAYQPNRLRLYVRNKLAVENFMNYLKNTQAFGKYIEGEIHFDILDTNTLPDIATANRQEYKENNDRVQKLIDILRPIVGALIRERSDMGTLIRKDEREYWEAKEAEEIAKREKAEQKARRAEEARQEAETKYQQAEDARQRYEEEVNVRKQQTYFLEAALTVDDRTSNYNTHIIKGNAEDIAENLKIISKKYPGLNEEQEFQFITYAINKIIMTAKKFSFINYDFKRTIENDDLGYFVEQYFNSMIFDDKIKIEIENTSNSYIRFPYQDVTMMLYNIVSNSKKAKATKLWIEMYNKDKNLILRFIDNGKGIENDIELNSLFNFGLSHTPEGTGIGLAQIKDLVENELNGTVTIERNKTKGVTLEVIIPNENQL